MALLPVKMYGEPVLRQEARPLEMEEVTEEFRQLIRDMAETMYDASGIGLAANQVGELRRFFVIDVAQMVDDDRKGRKKKEPKDRELLVFLNPEILETSLEDDSYPEGCLSIPEVEGDVYRPVKVKVRYRTLDWEEKVQWIDGMLARVFQHERDHLDGVLFVDHMAPAERRKVAGALNRLKKDTETHLAEKVEAS